MKKDGEFIDEFSYKLQGSPCGDVSKKGFCHYPESVLDLFPDDEALVEWSVEGYAGISLNDKSGNCLGTINKYDLEKINSIQRTEIPISELTVALQCGGSDSYSGIPWRNVDGTYHSGICQDIQNATALS